MNSSKAILLETVQSGKYSSHQFPHNVPGYFCLTSSWAGKKLLHKAQENLKKAHSTLTLNAPRRNRVGCKPTENISRNIVEAIKARMPWGLGRAITMARDISMAVHSKPDQWGSSVPRVRNKTHFNIFYNQTNAILFYLRWTSISLMSRHCLFQSTKWNIWVLGLQQILITSLLLKH